VKYKEAPRFSSFADARSALPTLSRKIYEEVGGLTRARLVFLRETLCPDLYFDYEDPNDPGGDTIKLMGKIMLELVGNKETGEVWYTNDDYTFTFHHLKYLLMLDGAYKQGIFEEVKDGDEYAYTLAGADTPVPPTVRTSFVIRPQLTFRALAYHHRKE
jgi:hypothetical protein